MLHVADQILHRGGLGILAQEAAAEVDTAHAALVCQGAELLVGEVAAVVTQGAGAGMAGHKGLFAVLDDIPEAALGQVAGVDDHAQLIHFGNDLQAEGLQPQHMLLRIVGAGEADGVFIVPGESHHADAPVIKLLDALDLSVHRDAVLHREHRGKLALLPVFLDVGHAAHGADDIGVGGHLPVKGVGAAAEVGIGLLMDMVILGGAVGGYENSEALHHGAALLQLFQVDMSGPVAQGVSIDVNGHQRITVQVDDVKRFHRRSPPSGL